jgi:hypothetical protein
MGHSCQASGHMKSVAMYDTGTFVLPAATIVNMSNTATVINITGKVSYTDEISISQAARIIAFLNSEDADTPVSAFGIEPPTQKQAPVASATGNKKVNNPRDAIDISGATKNPEKIVALGAYVLQDGGDTFKIEDVKSAFRRARETQPANFTRDLGVAVSSGWIFESDEAPDEYYLNNKMDAIFDGDFVFPKGSGGNGSRKGATKKTTSRAPRAKVAKPEGLEGIEEFRATLEGFPPYAKMKAEKDRLLWIVNYMREKHDRKTVTNKEIAWISDHIGTGIPANNVTGAFNSARTPGYAIRSTLDNTIKITEEGIEHLKSLTAEA